MFAKITLGDFYRRFLRVYKKFRLISSPKLNKQNLLVGLKRLGVEDGDIVYVHTSLSSFGYINGGADTLIDSLLKSVNKDGTVVVPSFSLKGLMVDTLSSNYVFNPKITPSSIGVLPETFRLKVNAIRSIHPTHSVSAIGKKAEWITKNHHLCKTTFGADTPFYKLLQENCLILLLGVDVQYPTFYHTFEDLNDSYPIDVYLKKSYKVKVLNYDGNVVTMNVKAHNPEISKYRIDHKEGLKIRRLFREYYFKYGGLKEVKIRKAKCYSIRSQDMYAVLEKLLKEGITIYNIE